MQSPRQITAEEHLANLTSSHEQLSQSYAQLLEQLNTREASIRHLEQQVASLLQSQRMEHKEIVASPSPSPTIRPKILPPSAFDGHTPHLDDWIFQWQQYFNVVSIPDEPSRVALVGLQLSGYAVHWYQNQYAQHQPADTEHLFADMISAFVPIDRSVFARSSLAELSQTGSVDVYIEQFRSLCLQIPDLSEAERLDRFLRGLQKSIYREVFLRDPKNLDSAMSMASRLDALSRLTNPRSNVVRRQDPSRSIRADHMELDNVQMAAPALASSRSPAKLRRTRLTDNERKRLRQTGSCFYCRKPGHIKANCPHRPVVASIIMEEPADAPLNAHHQ